MKPVRSTPTCSTCGDSGEVESLRDGPRPCSRCRIEAFAAWAREMRQQARAAAGAASPAAGRAASPCGGGDAA